VIVDAAGPRILSRRHGSCSGLALAGDAVADLVEPANFLMSAHVADGLAMKEVLRICRATHRRLSAQKRSAHLPAVFGVMLNGRAENS
jgi:hypothetical protein